MTLRASVTNGEPDAPPLTGSVQFAEEGGTPIGDPVFLDDTGHAELVAAAGAGDYVVKARYSGDSLHDPSTGQASQRVTQAATTTEIASSAAPATAGTPFVIGVAVSAEPPSEGVPTGEVRFSIDGAALGPRVPLDADGQVFIRVTASTAGSAVIGAHYAGDSDYVASEARLTQTVTGGPAAARTSAPPTSGGTPNTTPNRLVPLTRADLLASLRIPSVIGTRLHGDFRVGTITSTSVRSLALKFVSRRAKAPGRKPRTVTLARGGLSGMVITARLTKTGRAALQRRERVKGRLYMRAVDDTGNALTLSTTRTLRIVTRRAPRSRSRLSARARGGLHLHVLTRAARPRASLTDNLGRPATEWTMRLLPRPGNP
jgi:hypothetical protein